MPTEAIPFYEPGGNLTGKASATINSKRFLMISGDRVSDPTSVSDSIAGGNISVAQASAGARPIGVSSLDTASGDLVDILAVPGSIVPVMASGTITAGDAVSVTTDGKAISTATAEPVAATRNSGGSPGANNQLTYTARDAGTAGNGISVRLKDPAGNSASLSVDANGNDIVVNLATNGGGTVTSTAAQVKTAIEAEADANSLIVVTHTGASSGAGVVVADAGLQLTGGTDAGTAHVAGLAVATVANNEDAQVRLY